MWKFSELPYERVDVDRFIADGLLELIRSGGVN